MARRTGGSVRKLPSGRWQVRVRDRATGRLVPSGTYATKADADVELARAVADQSRGSWVAPSRAAVTLNVYARRWLDQHPRLSPRTREMYEGLLARHVLPSLGAAKLGDLTPATIRRWHAARLQETGASTTAKSYRLLRGILNTAVADELLARNPCVLKGAGIEQSGERPIATVPQVYALASAVPERFRVLVLVAAFAGLRLSELAALTRRNVDLLHATVTVESQRQRLEDQTEHIDLPKSAAGRRTVSLPSAVRDELAPHLDQFVDASSDALVFARADGVALDRHYWGRYWRVARSTVARDDPMLPEGLHFHDLRHTGNTLAASTGASTRELMARMGHSSPEAALRYQHATRHRDEAIAHALGEMIGQAKLGRIHDIQEGRNGRTDAGDHT